MTKIRDMKTKLNPDDKEKIRQDMKLQQMFIRKNLSKSRIDLNIIAFTKMYELTGLTPTELIDEALEEQEPRLINGQLRFKQINDRKNELFNQFIDEIFADEQLLDYIAFLEVDESVITLNGHKVTRIS